MNEKELLKQGIEWINENIKFRDEQMNKSGGFAQQYAIRYLRVVRRVLEYISTSRDNNQQFHDLLMDMVGTLNKDLFQIFFKMWSEQERKNNPIAIIEEYQQSGGVWIKKT